MLHLCYKWSKFTVIEYVDSDLYVILRKKIYYRLFTIVGGVISWVSNLHIVVALSTPEAKYMKAT